MYRIFKTDARYQNENSPELASNSFCMQEGILLPYTIWHTSKLDKNKIQITARQALLLIKLYGGDVSIMEKL